MRRILDVGPDLLASPGDYVLVLRLKGLVHQSVGSLGRFYFPAGWYCYVGSARGPGGLAARIRRHLGSPPTCHWHIDYLRRAATVEAVWWREGKRRRECAWAQALGRLPGAQVVAPRFGASDCRCETHLWLFQAAELPGLRDWLR